MNADSLRTILLVKAVEEQDADGAILPVAEREAATRTALRQLTAPTPGAARAEREQHGWRVLALRAEELAAKLFQRHPVVLRAVTLESHARPAAALLLVAALLFGVLLSALDSRVRIEILAFPLLGLVLWNLAIYAGLAIAALRRNRAAPPLPSVATGWSSWPARWGWRRAAALIRQSAFYHRPLAAALRRFSEEWWPVAQPLLLAQGTRIFHLCSAVVALGLVLGFYVRGIAFEYRAGWESTFLDPEQVGALLHVLYGPASALTGIPLPVDRSSIEALHWRSGAGGGPAADWIHLVAATAVMYVVLPRLLLAVAATVTMAKISRGLAVPDSLLPYARCVLASSDSALPAAAVHVTPFAYQPGTDVLDGAQRLLRAAFGADARIDIASAVPYGDEAAFDAPSRQGAFDVEVLLFSLAATPEAENHGAVLAAARARLAAGAAQARLLVLVDESRFLAHMQGDPALERRIAQRRDSWIAFVAAHGLEPCLADLASLRGPTDLPGELVSRVRRACRGRVP
jgi:hypothetical protein